MRLFILFLVIIFSACGNSHKKVTDYTSFETYVSYFEEQSLQHGFPTKVDDLIIKMGELKYPVVGLCLRNNYPFESTPTITIDRSYWNNSNETQRTVLILHELGHCIYNLDHNKDIHTVMYPNMDNAFYFDVLMLEEYYIEGASNHVE